MKLNVKERLELLNILPAEGNVVTLRVVQDLRMDLALSPEEGKLIGLKQDGAQLQWDETKDSMKDVAMPAATVGIVVELLKKLNGADKLQVGHLTLYEKFVEQPEPEADEGA